MTDVEPYFLSIDRRKTVRDLKDLIAESYPELMKVGDSVAVIHTARFLPAGLHLYDIISDKDEASLAALDLIDESNLFFWDGVKVQGVPVCVGEEHEPVSLHVTFPVMDLSLSGSGREGEEQTEVVLAFSKNTTLCEIRTSLSSMLGVTPTQVSVSHVKLEERRGKTHTSIVVFSTSKNNLTVSQLPLCDGDRLAVEKLVKKGVQTLAHSVADKRSKLLSFIVEDRCSPLQDTSSTYPLLPVEMFKDDTIATLRKKMFALTNIEGDVRFRVETDVAGLGPPLYEQQSLVEVEISQGQRVVMETGRPPNSTQICLQCKPASSNAGTMCEVILDKKLTIGECCSAMAMALGLSGDCWHLRRTNWCGEEADILQDETATLEMLKFKSGDVLIVEEGKLPPKGYIQLSILLYTPNQQVSLERPRMVTEASPSSQSSYATCCEEQVSSERESVSQAPGDQAGTSVKQLENQEGLSLLSPSQFYPPVPGDLVEIGSLQVQKEFTLDELKMLILTLPMFEESVIVSSSFLRVRELANGRPGKIFKQSTHTLKQLKLTSGARLCCQILSHEENLPTTAIVFNVCMRDPVERKYGPLTEVMYDTEGTPKGCSSHSLRVHLSLLLHVPLDRLRVAKHKIEAFEWILIQDSDECKQSKKKGRGGSGSKTNIKNSPVMLRDGDTVGFKDLRLCADDKDFATAEDDQGKAVLLAIQEDKRKRRKAKVDEDIFGPKEKRQRRPEKGIKIYVPDYQAASK